MMNKMKKEKCQKCKKEFEMPDNFYGTIICEKCDPFLNPKTESNLLQRKQNRGIDNLATPEEAILPLLPHLKKEWKIWECACGEGELVRVLKKYGFSVRATDVFEAEKMIGKMELFNFIRSNDDMVDSFDCIITNPPYSLKDNFLEMAYTKKKTICFSFAHNRI